MPLSPLISTVARLSAADSCWPVWLQLLKHRDKDEWPAIWSALTEGDLIMLFTDGLFEVEDSSGALFTEERLHLSAGRYATLPPKEFFSALLTEVRNFTQRETFDDDVCIVGLEVRQMTDAKVEKSHCRDK